VRRQNPVRILAQVARSSPQARPVIEAIIRKGRREKWASRQAYVLAVASRVVLPVAEHLEKRGDYPGRFSEEELVKAAARIIRQGYRIPDWETLPETASAS
jgi:hypothetical protein